MRIPVSWEARDYDKFRDLVSNENRGDIVSEMERIHTLAIGEAKTRRDLCDPEMERLAVRATITEDETIREAYRHLFRERARALKLRKDWHDLQKSSYLGLPGFGNTPRPHRLQIPDSLEGQPDRRKWPSIIRARYQDLHRLDQAEEREQVHKLSTALTKIAIRGPKIRIDPNSIRWSNGLSPNTT